MLQDILKTAMIGTEKFFPAPTSPLLQEVAEKIAAGKEDKEDAFLKLTAAYLLLQEAGKQLPVQVYQFSVAPADSQAQLSAAAASIVHQLLQSKEEALLAYALHRIAQSGKVARYDLLPALLSLASSRKDNTHLLQVCGERGKWLAQLNDSWKNLYAPSEEEIWETGTLPQRKAYLIALRKTNPQQARELLEASIASENAATRNELLEVLAIELSLQDEPFLQLQSKDKSSKVKQTAYTLLKLLPESAISKQYQAFLKEAVQLKEERVLLLAKKKVLEINQQVPYPEALAETGLEKVSSEKGVGDEEHWVAQTLEHLHPHFWQESYGLSLEQVVQLFAAQKQKALFMNRIFNAAFLHQHKELALVLLRSKEAPNPQILQLLPLQERYAFVDQFLDERSNASQLLPVLLDESFTPMPAAVCSKLLKFYSQEPYALTQVQYQLWALYMPAELLPELLDWARREPLEYQQRFFKNVTTEMIRIIETKEQLNASL